MPDAKVFARPPRPAFTVVTTDAPAVVELEAGTSAVRISPADGEIQISARGKRRRRRRRRDIYRPKPLEPAARLPLRRGVRLPRVPAARIRGLQTGDELVVALHGERRVTVDQLEPLLAQADAKRLHLVVQLVGDEPIQ